MQSNTHSAQCHFREIGKTDRGWTQTCIRKQILKLQKSGRGEMHRVKSKPSWCRKVPGAWPDSAPPGGAAQEMSKAAVTLQMAVHGLLNASVDLVESFQSSAG